MKPYYSLSRKATFLLAPVFLLLLASCGSTQSPGFENDGIYGDQTRRSTPTEPRPAQTEQSQYATQDNATGGYYKNLFAEKSQMYGQLAENMIFTDADDYSSDYEEEYYDENNNITYAGGRAPWGHSPDEYTINIYNTGFAGGFMNPWGWGYGWGNPWAWNDPFFWGDPFWGPWNMGWNMGPRWGVGFGWGFGGMWGMNRWGWGWNNWGMSPWGWNRWGMNPWIYGGGFYNYNNVAYNTGRRGALNPYSRGMRDNALSDARRSSTRSNSYSRSIRNIRSGEARGDVRRATIDRSNRNIYNRSSQRQPVRVNSNTSRRNDTYNRNTRNNNVNRSSNTNTRSSGTMRSSGGTRSSGGARTSSGGSRRGGGRG
ncbi:hypothetical protein ACW6QP_11045 [Salegentibacter sp. HM20]